MGREIRSVIGGRRRLIPIEGILAAQPGGILNVDRPADVGAEGMSRCLAQRICQIAGA
jgi:hypothetical protein